MLLTDKVLFSLTLIFATQLTRFIPLLFEQQIILFLKGEKIRNAINEALFFLLILYCYRDFSTSPEYILRGGVGVYVFLVQFFFGKTLFSISTGTFIYMLGRNYI